MDGFRTKRGHCVIDRGELRIERIGPGERFGRYAENLKLGWKQRDERHRLWFVLTFLAFLLGVWNVVHWRRSVSDSWLVVTVGLIAGIVAFPVVWRFGRRVVRRHLFGFAGERTIVLRRIESIEPRREGWFSGPRFVVRYGESGERKKRYVSVLSTSPLADEEFEKAKLLLLDAYDLPFAGGEERASEMRRLL